MQYAVIRSGGKQYKVAQGDTINVDKLSEENKKSILFEDVLLVVNEDKVSVGKPTVAGAKVEATLLENIKDEKIRVMKFKAKSRYRRTTGFRAQKSVVKIDKINFGGEKTEKKVTEPTKTAKKETEK